jgi:multimeric flavodoxin WrbA
MKLAIFNGSPRHKKSNSKILTDNFLKGFNRFCTDVVPVNYLANLKKTEENIEAFKNSETVIVIFPLYTDCMPGIVKEFFERIFMMKDSATRRIGFIVQSGFPEAIHSVYVEHYLRKFAERINCEYLGTVTKGGVEGIQIMPSWMTRKLFKQFESLGEYFAKNGIFSPEIKSSLGKPNKMSVLSKAGFQLFNKLGLTNFYWNSNLKKYGAFNKRFDQPYKS